MKNIVALIFSYNRPLQLDLAISSFVKNNQNPKSLDIICLYKADGKDFNDAYNTLKEEHTEVIFYKQDIFKYDVANILSGYEHIIFLTDDTIFVEKFSPTDIKNLLDNVPLLLGFSFRLGINVDYCYSLSQQQKLPPLGENIGGYLFWDWTKGECDWNYPLEVSSSMFRGRDIAYVEANIGYADPNQFEWGMEMYKRAFAHTNPLMACKKKSIAFSAPINKINVKNNNRSGDKEELSILSLLRQYQNGVRIDPDKFKNIEITSVHQEVDIL